MFFQIFGGTAPPADPLTAVLTDINPVRRMAGLTILSNLGPGARHALPALARCLEDPQAEVRRMAVVAVMEVGGDSLETVEALAMALNDADPVVRRRAAAGLATLGQTSEPVLDRLLVALQDTNDGVRRHVMAALGALGPVARDAVPALQQVFHSNDLRGRAIAKLALRNIDPNLIDLSA